MPRLTFAVHHASGNDGLAVAADGVIFVEPTLPFALDADGHVAGDGSANRGAERGCCTDDEREDEV